MTTCWCGNSKFLPFGMAYGECPVCETLVSLEGMTAEQLQVRNDETDFYGKQYWLAHQSNDLGFPDIQNRARNDLTERNLHWLKALLKYRLPPANVLELGCSHGSFVAVLRQAGFTATGDAMDASLPKGKKKRPLNAKGMNSRLSEREILSNRGGSSDGYGIKVPRV